MAFESYEDSVEGSRPIELYEFIYQGTTTRWTSYDRDVTVNLLLYRAAPGLTRSDIEDSGKNVANPNVTITGPADFEPAQVFSICPPSDVVNVLIKRTQASDIDDPQVIWAGRVLSVSWPLDAVKMTCQSIYTRLKQPGLRRLYGKSCPHMLYKTGEGECNADKASFKATVLISGADGVTIQGAGFAAFADGYFNGGMIETEITPGVIEKRGIKTHVGDTITVTHRIPGLVGLTNVDAYPGCDHTRLTCQAKFNNENNYGGFPFVPLKNPYGAASVF